MQINDAELYMSWSHSEHDCCLATAPSSCCLAENSGDGHWIWVFRLVTASTGLRRLPEGRRVLRVLRGSVCHATTGFTLICRRTYHT